jgi:pimeloyl-ACP methyl ester carboxylesterase
VRVDTLRVLNPGSGCSLYVHIHRPVTSTHANRLPGIILVPDAQHPGTFFDFLDIADKLADAGFVVLHFDADGRGQSPGWPEDYGGFVHQDGLHACLELLARQTEVDSQCLGIVARGDGTTMTTGAVARYPSPVVSFLLDDEGPADRHQSCVDSGGTIPVAPDSELFWQEREAGRFAKRVPAAYLRLQTTTSPNPRIPGNRDCIAMIDSMTAVTHGGRGVSRWTRVNDSAMNPPNKVYDDGRRPTVIPDEQELHTLIRCLLYLRELSRLPVQAVAESDLHPPSAALKLSVSPNPARSPVRVHFDVSPAGRLLPAEFSLRLYNATGRLVRTLATGPLLTGANGLAAGDWNLDTGRSRLEPGVFLLRLVAGSHSLSRKLVVE